MSTFDAVAAKIETFQMLPQGWDYGRDGPASALSRTGAMALLSLFKESGIINFDAAPGREGAITIVALKDGQDVEILCRATGAFDVHLHPVEGEDDVRYDLSLGSVIEVLRGSGWLKATSSILCTLTGIYLARADTRVRRLRTQVMDLEYPSYVWIASSNQDGQFAITFENSPPSQFQAIPQFSGGYREIPYQKAAC